MTDRERVQQRAERTLIAAQLGYCRRLTALLFGAVTADSAADRTRK